MVLSPAGGVVVVAAAVAACPAEDEALMAPAREKRRDIAAEGVLPAGVPGERRGRVQTSITPTGGPPWFASSRTWVRGQEGGGGGG